MAKENRPFAVERRGKASETERRSRSILTVVTPIMIGGGVEWGKVLRREKTSGETRGLFAVSSTYQGMIGGNG